MNMSFESYVHRFVNKPSHEAFVAFLDILGFSDFVRYNSHEDMVKIYQSCFRLQIDSSLVEVAEQYSGNSAWLEEMKKSKSYNLAPDFCNVQLNCLSMSDSIVLATSSCDVKDFLILVTTVRNLMARALYFGLPLRGAITQGMITLDKEITPPLSNISHFQMLGLPFVEAASLEKRQLWSGCAIHSSAVHKIGRKIIKFDPNIVFCDVPVRTDKPKEIIYETMPVVNWLHGIADEDKSKMNVEKIESSFSAHKKRMTADAEIIMNNTINFFREMANCPVYKNEMDIIEYLNCIDTALKEMSSQIE